MPRIGQLLEMGLRHFALGELEHAKAAWKQAIAIEPGNERAEEYLRLVASVSTGPLPEVPATPGPPEAGLADWGLAVDAYVDDPWSDDGRSQATAIPAHDPSRPLGQLYEGSAVSTTGWDVDGGAAPVELGGGSGDALALIDDEERSVVPSVPSRPAGPAPDPQSEGDTLMEGARELFELGDFSGSLQLVQKALALAPGHPEALEYLERNEDTLIEMYESKLGSLEARPRIVLQPDEIVWLHLDHRAGFVLSRIDGTVSVDDIYAVSSLPRLDTAKILAELVEQGVIAT